MRALNNIRRLCGLTSLAAATLFAAHANAWCVRNVSNEQDRLTVLVNYQTELKKRITKPIAYQDEFCVAATEPGGGQPGQIVQLIISAKITTQGQNGKPIVTTKDCSSYSAGAGFGILGEQNASVDLYQRDIPEIKVKKGDAFIDTGTGSGKDIGQTRFTCR
jgi:hypothetical protein